ncbi:MAG TPA: saccharopine dehydrogenase NADP-binding domain-containing protein [Candidatus Binatia bacterium]|jgi:short subunit dehydrogenase-like uncharacterized protein|nr:saccharopine dehydrogenase NADP-binding domain-containing protein [Candidatus Binatia bacterium]
MSQSLLIYGATGHTGRLLAREAVRRGLRPVLAGRDAAKVSALASSLGCEARVTALTDAAGLANALRDVGVVLHAAGPFSRTAAPMAAACLAAGVHYLDLTGEIAVFAALSVLDREARRRGIMVMPGVGFDVVPSDCLAAHVARRLPGATRLALGLRGFGAATRGSTQTLIEHAGRDVRIRRDGALVPIAPGTLERRFDYGVGPRASVNVGWGDVFSSWYTTGIPNVETYVEATPAIRLLLGANRWLAPVWRSPSWQTVAQSWASLLPDGAMPLGGTSEGMTIVAEAEDDAGHRVRARLRTPEAYAFSGAVGVAIAERVLAGDVEPGYQTPGRVYGPDFVLRFAGVVREDLP